MPPTRSLDLDDGWTPIRRGTTHVLFWGGTFVFFVLYFGRGGQGLLASLLFVALLLPVAMATTYFFTGVLVPRFLLKRRYGLFTLYGIYTLIASVYLELVVIVVTFIVIAGYTTSAMNPATLDLFGMVVALYVVVCLALAANLTQRWQRLRREHDEMERTRLESELELRDAELSRLKAQMQPHFLFNTLNNLYGLTLEGSEAAPEVVLKMSEMLDYVLYRCERPVVPLLDEIQHLRTYLDLERLRFDERVELRFWVEDRLPEAGIAPLLLIPFIENSFKHGVSRTNGPSSVDIRLAARDARLHFSVENTQPSDAGRPAGNDQPHGIGLANVRRRLELLYPDAHRLTILDHADRFRVDLRIPLHPLSKSARQEAAT